MLRRASHLAVGSVFGFVLLNACGGPSERHCASESAWDGKCQLRGVTKLREAEFPVPHVVMEVMYEPQQSPSSPNFTPPPVRQEMKIMASQEPELRSWLEQHQVASCHMAAPPPGKCEPGPVQVALPEFRATGATVANEIRGCAQIESTASQDKLPELSKNAAQLPEVFMFEQNSAEPSGAAAQTAAQVAARLRDNPGIECIAVVGQTSPGEQPVLANDRARSIVKLLTTGGVDSTRLTSITVTEAVFGTGTAAPPPDPNKRRVTLRILLQKK